MSKPKKAENPDQSEWVFYSTDSDQRFTITKHTAKLSGLFKNVMEISKENTVVLEPVDQKHETADLVFKLNTTRLLKFVHEYFKLWESNPEKSNYVKVEPIHTSEFLHVLQPVDLQFITNYIHECVLYYSEHNDLDIGKFNDFTSYNKKWTMTMLSELLCQVDELLDIECLSNKIYAYIAVLVWNTSAVDFSNALDCPEFKEAQEKAIQEYLQDGHEYLARHFKETGQIPCLAPKIESDAMQNIDELEDLVDLQAPIKDEDEDSNASDDSNVSDDEDSE